MVTDPAGRAYDHGYDPNGNRASLAHPNGADDRLHLRHPEPPDEPRHDHPSRSRTIQSYAFTLGPAGNRTRIVEAQACRSSARSTTATTTSTA